MSAEANTLAKIGINTAQTIKLLESKESQDATFYNDNTLPKNKTVSQGVIVLWDYKTVPIPTHLTAEYVLKELTKKSLEYGNKLEIQLFAYKEILSTEMADALAKNNVDINLFDGSDDIRYQTEMIWKISELTHIKNKLVCLIITQRASFQVYLERLNHSGCKIVLLYTGNPTEFSQNKLWHDSVNFYRLFEHPDAFCKFFNHSGCLPKKDCCNYTHRCSICKSPEHGAVKCPENPNPQGICISFVLASCKLGSKCNFSHVCLDCNTIGEVRCISNTCPSGFSLSQELIKNIPIENSKLLEKIKLCPERFYCLDGLKCKKTHSLRERECFENNQGRGIGKNFTSICAKGDSCSSRKICTFAHEKSEYICSYCAARGDHLVSNCPIINNKFKMLNTHSFKIDKLNPKLVLTLPQNKTAYKLGIIKKQYPIEQKQLKEGDVDRSSKEVTILWDYDNVAIPSDQETSKVLDLLNTQALLYGRKVNIEIYTNGKNITNKVLLLLHQTQHNIRIVNIKENKFFEYNAPQGVDKKIIWRMSDLSKLQQVCILITGDSGYKPFMIDMVQLGCRVVLIYPKRTRSHFTSNKLWHDSKSFYEVLGIHEVISELTTNIKTLNINKITISDKLLKEIAENNSGVVSLKKHFIGDTDISQIMVTLSQNALITNLDLSDTELSNKNAAVIAQYLPSSKIRVLNLSNNLIKGTGAAVLSIAIAYSEQLEILDLTNNQIPSYPAKLLLLGLKRNKNLVTIKLENNLIRNELLNEIQEYLSSKKTESASNSVISQPNISPYTDKIDAPVKTPEIKFLIDNNIRAGTGAPADGVPASPKHRVGHGGVAAGAGPVAPNFRATIKDSKLNQAISSGPIISSDKDPKLNQSITSRPNISSDKDPRLNQPMTDYFSLLESRGNAGNDPWKTIEPTNKPIYQYSLSRRI